MRILGVVLVIWLIIGAIAGAQRHYYNSDPGCARTGTISRYGTGRATELPGRQPEGQRPLPASQRVTLDLPSASPEHDRLRAGQSWPSLERGSLPETGAAGRLEAAHRLGLPDQRAQASQVSRSRAMRPGLDQRVAQRGGLGRAGQHGKPAGVGGELAEQRVPRRRRRPCARPARYGPIAAEPAGPRGDEPAPGCQVCSGPFARARRASAARFARRPPRSCAGMSPAGEEFHVVGVEDRRASAAMMPPGRAARRGWPAAPQLPSTSSTPAAATAP